MLRKTNSITQRLILAVLLTEFVAALVLIASVTANEQHVQFKLFDTVLSSTSNVLLGSVQDADDQGDNVILDMRGVNLPRGAIFRVTDEKGRYLGGSHATSVPPVSPGQYRNFKVDGESYRFYALAGDRIVDPGKEGGIHHNVTTVVGLPDHHVWHEVWEAVRFFSIASIMLLTVTALLLIWIIRALTNPIHQLATAAESISAFEWTFTPPENARKVAELEPLVNALESAMMRLHRSFQQQRRFTSDAAHELKTDLAIVKSSLQLLSMKPRTNDEYQRGVSLGLEDLGRLEETVQRMLTLARLEQPLIGEGHECSIDEALLQAVHQALPAAELKSVTLNTGNINHAKVHCDPRDGLLLCSNILMNAIQYTGECTTVKVACEVQEAQVRISVNDAGPGIQETELPYIFEPFYRGDPSRSRKSGGTGLGLSICKAICLRAGGHIFIANNQMTGVEVIVELPIIQNRE